MELAKYGEILEMFIVDNIGDHMIGNIFVKFMTEEDAKNVKDNVSRRKYREKFILPEYSPVTDFERGSCRKFKRGNCRRGGNCNFLHVKKINKRLLRALYTKMYKDQP